MTASYQDTVARAHEHEALAAVDRAGAHAVVTLDDPERLNPLSAPLTIQLHQQLSELVADPQIRAILITGADPAFSAGGDLSLIRETGERLLNESPGGACSRSGPGSCPPSAASASCPRSAPAGC